MMAEGDGEVKREAVEAGAGRRPTGAWEPAGEEMAQQGPAHHLAAEHIQHRRQVQEALLGRHVSDVCYPQLVWLCRLESAQHPVRRHGRFPVSAGRATPSLTRRGLLTPASPASNPCLSKLS